MIYPPSLFIVLPPSPNPLVILFIMRKNCFVFPYHLTRLPEYFSGQESHHQLHIIWFLLSFSNLPTLIFTYIFDCSMFTLVDWLARLEMRPGRSRRDHPRRIWQPSKHYTLYSISVVHKMLVYVYLCCIPRYSFMKYIDSIVLYRRRHLQRATITNIYRKHNYRKDRGGIYKTQKEIFLINRIYSRIEKKYMSRKIYILKNCKTEIYSSRGFDSIRKRW